MANTQGSIKITPESLNTSYQKFRSDLITMPMFSLEEALPYMTLRRGVRFKETVGELKGQMELAPYKVNRRSDKDMEIIPRTLETFLGNAVQGFDPNSVLKSVYGSDIVQGEGLKNVPITKKVWVYLFGLLGENLFNALFTAKRVDEGDTTMELFNGFKTILEDEKTHAKISEELKNYHKIPEDPSATNAVELIEGVYDAVDYKLRQRKTNMLMSPKMYRLYCLDYRSQFGALPYNQKFDKVFIEGSKDRCTLVSLPNVPDDTIIVTEKSNMLIGIDTEGPEANFEVTKSLTSHWLLDFVASMFMGCQFESINKERLLYAKVDHV